MIIGKSITALGGGGLKPEIRVTAKAGALLNLHFKDSSIILQTYQLGAEETQHTFAVDVSETAYVVEDVTNSKSVEVLVDAVAQYSVEITYILWLYKNGDECEEVTGGFSGLKYGANATFSKNISNLYLHSYRASFVTNKSVDLTGFNVLKAHITDSTSRSAAGYNSHIIEITSNNVGEYGRPSGWVKEDGNNVAGETTISLDISSYNSEYYVNVISDDNNNSSYMYVDKIWLE